MYSVQCAIYITCRCTCTVMSLLNTIIIGILAYIHFAKLIKEWLKYLRSPQQLAMYFSVQSHTHTLTCIIIRYYMCGHDKYICSFIRSGFKHHVREGHTSAIVSICMSPLRIDNYQLYIAILLQQSHGN